MKLKHILLSLGLLVLTFSTFFSVQFHEGQFVMWICAALVSFICTLVILFGNEPWKRKLMWVACIAGMILIERSTHRFQFDTSCRMYMAENQASLNKLVSAVKPMEEELSFFVNWEMKDTSAYKTMEDSLRYWLKDSKAQAIIKSKDWEGNEYIYIELWGFLDARFGLTYYEVPIPEEYYKPIHHISGNWYR